MRMSEWKEEACWKDAVSNLNVFLYLKDLKLNVSVCRKTPEAASDTEIDHEYLNQISESFWCDLM